MVDLFVSFGGWLHDVFVKQLDFWIILGFVAQALFTARFVVQWIASERAGRSVVPVAFWIFSMAGGLLLFIYAVARHDPVFIAGQAFGNIVYMRNLALIRKNARKDAAAKS